MKCVYMGLMSLDATGTGRKRWTMRWKAPLNAFQIEFEGRLAPASAVNLTHPFSASAWCRSRFGPLSRYGCSAIKGYEEIS